MESVVKPQNSSNSFAPPSKEVEQKNDLCDKKEYMNKYMREYRKKNNGRFTEIGKCEICNCNYKKINKSHHYKSKKHELNMLRQMVDRNTFEK
jgi:hypothetical protein